MTPPPYALLEVVGVCELAQVYPRADGVKTLCLACGFPFGDAEEACTCTSALRSQAVAVLHAELVAGRDPEPALQRWRAERLAAGGQSAGLADPAGAGDQVGGELRGQG